jgi:hypothetical protein
MLLKTRLKLGSAEIDIKNTVNGTESASWSGSEQLEMRAQMTYPAHPHWLLPLMLSWSKPFLPPHWKTLKQGTTPLRWMHPPRRCKHPCSQLKCRNPPETSTKTWAMAKPRAGEHRTRDRWHYLQVRWHLHRLQRLVLWRHPLTHLQRAPRSPSVSKGAN